MLILVSLLTSKVTAQTVIINVPSEVVIYINSDGTLVNGSVEFGKVSNALIFLESSGICYTKGTSIGDGLITLNDTVTLKVTAKDWRDKRDLRLIPNQTFPYVGDPNNQKGTLNLGFDVKLALMGGADRIYEAGDYKLEPAMLRSIDVKIQGHTRSYSGSYKNCYAGDVSGSSNMKSANVEISNPVIIKIRYK